MFKVKFDMTEGRYRRVANRTAAVMRPHSSSANARRRYGTATTSGAPAYKRRHAVGSMTNVTAPAQAGADMSQRYSPVFERAEDPTIAEDFMPADPQTQHKIFRNLIMFDPIAGPATEYYRDLAFSSNVILSGIEDGEIIQFYQDAIEASGIIPIMPVLLSDYLTFGKFVFHMIMDTKMGYWTETIPHDLDYVSIKVSPIPSLDPIIDIQPTQDMREWAISSDERVVSQRRDDLFRVAALCHSQIRRNQDIYVKRGYGHGRRMPGIQTAGVFRGASSRGMSAVGSIYSSGELAGTRSKERSVGISYNKSTRLFRGR